MPDDDIGGVYTLHDLCRALQMSVRQFREHRPQMEREGFPRHLPGLRHRWSKDEVDAYLRRRRAGEEHEREELEREDAERRLARGR